MAAEPADLSKLRDEKPQPKEMSTEQREEMLKSYLPKTPRVKSIAPKRPQPIRGFVKSRLHLFVFTVLHTLFSVYIRIRQTYHIVFDRVLAILYYHHRAPELIKQDVKDLTRLPGHLSVILEMKREGSMQVNLENLMDELAEVAAWSACVGIQMLSVYERTGRLSANGFDVAYN